MDYICSTEIRASKILGIPWSEISGVNSLEKFPEAISLNRVWTLKRGGKNEEARNLRKHI
jgi:hypothetical protein